MFNANARGGADSRPRGAGWLTSWNSTTVPRISPEALRSGCVTEDKTPSFRGSIPSPPVPLFTLRQTPRGAHRKTRGQDGLLLLSCKTLSFSTTCRFIPAHGQTTIWLLIGQLREVRPVNIRRVTESTAADRRLVREVMSYKWRRSACKVKGNGYSSTDVLLFLVAPLNRCSN